MTNSSSISFHSPIAVPHQLTANVKLLQKAVLVVTQPPAAGGAAAPPLALILQRSPSAKSRPSCWDLPGGNSEWPSVEPLAANSQANLHQQDIRREVEEETGLAVQPEQFNLKKLVHFSTYFAADLQVFTIICGWKVVLAAQPAVKISDEHTAFAWISAAQLPEYDFGGAKGSFVVDMIEKALVPSTIPVYQASATTERAYAQAKKEERAGKLTKVDDLNKFFDEI